jgi:uncharacterized membrane protein
VGDRDKTRQLVNGLGLFSLGLGTAQLVAPDTMNRMVGADDDPRNRALQRWLGGARELAVGTGIESRRRPAVWMWTRVAGDLLDLGMLGALVVSPGRPRDARRRAAVVTTTVVGVLAADFVAALRLSRRGAHARKIASRGEGIEAAGWITVNRPVAEVFAYWQDLEDLPRFMTHLRSVRSLGGGRSRWQAEGPPGVEVVWEAEISDQRIDERIAWRSLAGASVANQGEVEFRPAPGQRGTEVRVRLRYDPPAGKLGAAAAKLFGEAPGQQVRDDLRRFKQVLEAGEVVRSEGSPEGTSSRRLVAQRPAQPNGS